MSNKYKFEKEKMKAIKNYFLFIFTLVGIIGLSSCSERIDAGHEGIKVNLYGSDKGVDNVSLVTGRVWYNPFTTEIYEYPSFVQTVDYEPFTINAKDGSEFMVDPTISLKIETGKSPEIFQKYRKKVDEIIKTTLYNYTKDAFRVQLNKFTTDEIVSKREEVEIAIENQLRTELKKEYFVLEQLTSGLKYPQSIVESVNMKNKAVQEAQRVENELAIVKAEAEKKIVAAEAEKKANELRTQGLTPAILQQQWIEKWDGSVPKVITSENAGMFLNIAK